MAELDLICPVKFGKEQIGSERDMSLRGHIVQME